MDQLVSDLLHLLDVDLREEFEERAAIVEFDGPRARDHAECLAMLDVLRRHPALLARATVVEVELDGCTRWLLTTDADGARRLAGLCGDSARLVDLVEVIEGRFGGAAVLAEVP